MSKISTSSLATIAEKGYTPVVQDKNGKYRINAANFSEYLKNTQLMQKVLFKVAQKLAVAKEEWKAEMSSASAERKAEMKASAPAIAVYTGEGEDRLEIKFDENNLSDYMDALDARMKNMVMWYNGALKWREFKKGIEKMDDQGRFTIEEVTKNGKTTRVLATNKRTNNAINIPRYLDADFIKIVAEDEVMSDVESVFYDAAGNLITSMPPGIATKVLRLYLQRTNGYQFKPNASGKGQVLHFSLTQGGGRVVADFLTQEVINAIQQDKKNFDPSDLPYTSLGIIVSKLAVRPNDEDKKALVAYYDEVRRAGGDFGAAALDAAIKQSTDEIRAAYSRKA